MIFLASEINVRVVFGFGDVESFDIFDVLKHNSHNGTVKMASIGPMGAHAAFKIRENLSGPAPGQEKNERHTVFQAQSMSPTEMKCKQPAAQYNGKLMAHIWGIYNMYSVHNLKNIHRGAIDKA